MKEASSNMFDPIPQEDLLQMRPATDGKPAGVRFLAFNTVVDIEAYGAPEACEAAFEEARALCRTYERLFSRTLPHSDIARLNAAKGQPMAIDPRTYDLLAQAVRYCAESEGAFDITVGPAIRLWDFHNSFVADSEKLAQAVQHIDWRTLQLWEEGGGTEASVNGAAVISRGEATSEVPDVTARKAAAEEASDADPVTCRTQLADSVTYWAQLADPEAAVDAGGIAKGWIADALIAAMEARGLSGIIVNLGGNVAVSGTKPDGQPWRVGIRDPRNPEQLIGAVPLVRGSAVTSGIYERCFTTPDDAFYHHILDPHTGMPAETDTAGVTVICEKSIDAEGFSTTLLALGKERGIQLVRKHPEITQAFFIDTQGNIAAARG